MSLFRHRRWMNWVHLGLYRAQTGDLSFNHILMEQYES